MAKQKLLTKELERKLPPLYSQEQNPDPTAVVKFFCPWSNWSWYATEYDAKTKVFFGLVIGQDTELGYFGLEELARITHRSGLKIERDIFFKPTPLSEIRKGRC